MWSKDPLISWPTVKLKIAKQYKIKQTRLFGLKNISLNMATIIKFDVWKLKSIDHLKKIFKFRRKILANFIKNN